MLQFVRSSRESLKRVFSNTSFVDVIKSAIRVSPLSLIRLACGFFRSKIAAIFLGVAGVGLLGEANQFFLLVTTIGSLGMVNSLMQQMSLYRENHDEKNLELVKGTVLTSQLFFLALFALVVSFAFKPITIFFFNNQSPDFSILILIICISSPLNVLASNYIEGFFTAYHRFDLYIKASSIATILSLVLFVPAIYFWKVEGGLISIITGELVLFLLFLFYVLKIEKLKNVFVFKFDRSIFKLTFRDGTVNLFCSFLAGFSGLLLRQMVIKNTGEFNNGIYQFCLSITAYYTPFLTNLLWAKYFPVISAKRITDETKEIIQNTFLFIVVASSAVIIGLLISSELVIRILATKDFIAAQKYLPFQFLGDYWYFIFYLYSIFLLAMRLIKRYLIMWVFYLGLQYVLAKVLVVFWGLTGVIAGYSISSMVAGIVSVYFFTKVISGRPVVIYKGIFTSFIFVILEATLTILNITIFIKLVLFVAWLYWFVRPIIGNKLKNNITAV